MFKKVNKSIKSRVKIELKRLFKSMDFVNKRRLKPAAIAQLKAHVKIQEELK